MAESHYHLGAALQKAGQMDQALAEYQKALAINPRFAEAACQIGVLLMARDQSQEAIDYLLRAVTERPDYARAHNNLGAAQYNTGRFEESIASFQRAIALRPDYAEAHWNLGLAHLIGGDFARGWTEYRRGWPHQTRLAPIQYPGVEWDGSNLAGKRILIHNLWALGDAIQMARFLPRVAELGGRIICCCHRPLHRILRQIAPVEQWIGLDEQPPAYEVQCALMALPAILGVQPNEFAPFMPYLIADTAAVARWKSRMPLDNRLKVGLVWAARSRPAVHRPPPLAFSPLAGLKDAWFCSVQKPIGLAGLPPDPPPGLTLTDWTNELNDLADTAALLANLDLVITVDTAVAHLAGAMGRPAWVLLEKFPDWRWMTDRPDSPWYPTIKLFRQPKPGDWVTPIEQIVADIQHRSR
jgi:hypothetical protein